METNSKHIIETCQKLIVESGNTQEELQRLRGDVQDLKELISELLATLGEDMEDEESD